MYWKLTHQRTRISYVHRFHVYCYKTYSYCVFSTFKEDSRHSISLFDSNNVITSTYYTDNLIRHHVDTLNPRRVHVYCNNAENLLPAKCSRSRRPSGSSSVFT